MNSKERLSASVDADLIRAAENAVAHGRSGSVSAWVNDALRLKVEHDDRLTALAALIARHEAKHGEITPEEMRKAEYRMRSRAIVVRPAPKRPRNRRVRSRAA